MDTTLKQVFSSLRMRMKSATSRGLVMQVAPSNPVARMGLHESGIIIQPCGQAIYVEHPFVDHLSVHKPQQTVSNTFLRNCETYTVQKKPNERHRT